ncbi:hypothetical protein JL720_9518 [Aureococcus anophagefferens]|nr:hypothetical protein JL720_9518 [Aureococcus anophagefferens]
MRLRALLATVIFRACTAANSTWTTSGVVEAGHGVGWCLQPSDAGASDWRARVVVRRVATNSSGPRYRLYSARDHVYVLAFALDASRDLARRAGEAARREPRPQPRRRRRAGVVPLAVLADVERETRVRDKFDVFAGTSTGAIVAAGLALAELPVAVVQRLYDDLVRLIFGSKGLSPKFRAGRLQAILEAVFGADSTLRGDGGRRLVVVATDASTARLRPFLFRSFPPPEADDDDYLVDARSHHCRVVDALMASTAAPPFFPVRRFDVDGSPRRLLDGALVANNPTHFALAEASALRRGDARTGAPEQTLDLVVSLGTGAAPAKARSSAADARSFLGAIPRSVSAARDFVEGLANLLTDTDTTHDLVKRTLRETWRGDELHERCHRLDAVIDARHLRLDEGDVDVLRDLRAMALDFLKRDKHVEWKALLRALKQGPGKKKAPHVYSVVDLDVVAAPPAASALRPLRKTCAHGLRARGSTRAKVTTSEFRPCVSLDSYCMLAL